MRLKTRITLLLFTLPFYFSAIAQQNINIALSFSKTVSNSQLNIQLYIGKRLENIVYQEKDSSIFITSDLYAIDAYLEVSLPSNKPLTPYNNKKIIPAVNASINFQDSTIPLSNNEKISQAFILGRHSVDYFEAS